MKVKLISIDGEFECRPSSKRPFSMIEVRIPWAQGEVWIDRYIMEVKRWIKEDSDGPDTRK